MRPYIKDEIGQFTPICRFISATIVFFFVTTSLDIQLASASFIPAPLPAQPVSDSVHYMNDFSDLAQQQNQDPLAASPDKAGQSPEQAKLAEEPVDSTFFLNAINPLSEPKEGTTLKISPADNNGNIKWEYSDENPATADTYFIFNDQSKQIIEIGDFTSVDYEDKLEIRQFDYQSIPNAVRIETRVEGVADSLTTYQVFELDTNGNLGDLLRAGYALGEGVDVLMREKKDNQIHVYETLNDGALLIKKYQIDENGKTGRLNGFTHVAKLGQQDAVETTYLIEYTSDVRYKSVSQVFENGETGIVWKYEVQGTSETLVELRDATSLIQLNQITRFGEQVDVYQLFDTTLPGQYSIYERLPSGSMGRLLRLKDDKSDVEYLYGYDDIAGNETLTILNYENSVFLKVKFQANEQSGAQSFTTGDFYEAGQFELTADGVRYLVQLERSGSVWRFHPDGGDAIYEYEVLDGGEIGRVIGARGPPSSVDIAFKNEFLYDKDRLTVLDNKTRQYATYNLSNLAEPELIENGSFSRDDQNKLIFSPVSVQQKAALAYDQASLLSSAAGYLANHFQISANDLVWVSQEDSENPLGAVLVRLKSGSLNFEVLIAADGVSVLQAVTLQVVESGNIEVREYDAAGRVTRIYDENQNGERNLLKEYRYSGGQLTVIDFLAKTIQIAKLAADGKSMGEGLSFGFFNDNEKIYSLQGVNDKEAQWKSYGADGLMLTEDDGSAQRPARGPKSGGGQGGDQGLPSGNPRLDGMIQDLRRMYRSFQGCANERRMASMKLSKNCEEMMGEIEAQQKAIESEQLRGVGLFDGQSGGGGEQNLNYGNPAPTPEFLPELTGEGAAPINAPDAEVIYLEGGRVRVALNDFVQLWSAGSDNKFGTADDILNEVIETATGMTWEYDNGVLKTARNEMGEIVATYQYETDSDNRKSLIVKAGEEEWTYQISDMKRSPASSDLIRHVKNVAGIANRQTFQNGRIVESCVGNSCDSYSYAGSLNQVTITNALGKTRIISMGGDHQFGNADDFIVGGTAVSGSSDNMIIDSENGLVTSFVYGDGQVTVSTSRGGNILNWIVVRLEDGKLDSGDRILSASGWQNGHMFVETFDAEGRLLEWTGWEMQEKRDDKGRLLRADGSLAQTLAEAAREANRVTRIYTWKDGETDQSVTVSTYGYQAGTLMNAEPDDVVTYGAGLDKTLLTSDDPVTSVRRMNPLLGISFEQRYDDKGRVVFYKNLNSGDELFYEFDDANNKVTITSSLGYFKQVFEFNKDFPGDFSKARLIEEERDKIKRIWDKDEKATSVTDKEGVTTFFRNGLVVAVVKRDGTVIREYQHVRDPATGEIRDAIFAGKESFETDSFCVNDDCSVYRVVYGNAGVVMEYRKTDRGPVLTFIGDVQGTEFVQTTDQATGSLIINYNDGRRSEYRQVAGFYEIQVSTDIYGDAQTYCYHKGSKSQCQTASVATALEKVRAALDKMNAEDKGDTKSPESSEVLGRLDLPKLHYSVGEDGSVKFYADRSAETWQDVPNALYEVDKFGAVTTYFYADNNTDLVRTIQQRSDGSYERITEYESEGGRTKATYDFSADGIKIISRTQYTYVSDDKENQFYRSLVTSEVFNVTELNVNKPSDVPAGSGWIQNRTHHLKSRPGESEEASSDLRDWFGLGLVDYSETYRRPDQTGGTPVFVSITKQVYRSIQLIRGLTYRNLESKAVCGAGFSGCEIVSFDDYFYVDGTRDVDFTKRYRTLSNSLDGAQLTQVFRSEKIDERTTIVHDFGRDFTEDTSDDKFSLQKIVKLDADMAETDMDALWGAESWDYRQAIDGSLTEVNGYAEILNRGLLTELQSHQVSNDLYEDGSMVRVKNYEMVDGVETGEVMYTLSQKRSGSDQGFDGTLRGTLLGDLDADEQAKYLSQDFSYSQSWKEGFDQADSDRFLRSESYSVSARDEETSRSVSRNPVTEEVLYSSQIKNHDAGIRSDLLGAGESKLDSSEDVFESKSFLGAFGTAQFLKEVSFTIDIYGNGNVVRSKSNEVIGGQLTGKVTFSEQRLIARNTVVFGLFGNNKTAGQILLGTSASDNQWEHEKITQSRTWGESFNVEEVSRELENESYSIISKDQKITRSAARNVKNNVISYTEQIKIAPEALLPNGKSVAESLLGADYTSAMWKDQPIFWSRTSKDSFDLNDRYIDSESYQITSKDESTTRSIIVDRNHPDAANGAKLSFEQRVRVPRSSVVPKLALIPDEEQSEKFSEVFDDPDYQFETFFEVTSSLDDFADADRFVHQHSFQLSARDGQTVHTLSLNDYAPVGDGDDASFKTIATYTKTETLLKSEVLDELELMNDPELEAQILPLLNLPAEQYVEFQKTSTPTGYSISWSLRDRSQSYSLAVDSGAVDGAEWSFSVSERLARNDVIQILDGTSTRFNHLVEMEDSEKTTLRQALGRSDAEVSFTTQGTRQTLQIAVMKEPNMSFMMSFDSAQAGARWNFIEQRTLSNEVLKGILLGTVKNTKYKFTAQLNAADKAELVNYLSSQSMQVSVSLSGSQISIQASLYSDRIRSWGLSVNSALPGAFFELNKSRRVSRAVVTELLAGNFLVEGAQPMFFDEDDETALSGWLSSTDDWVVMEQLTGDRLTYQITSTSDPNVSYVFSLDQSVSELSRWEFSKTQRVTAAQLEQHTAFKDKDILIDDSVKAAYESLMEDPLAVISVTESNGRYAFSANLASDPTITFQASVDVVAGFISIAQQRRIAVAEVTSLLPGSSADADVKLDLSTLLAGPFTIATETISAGARALQVVNAAVPAQSYQLNYDTVGDFWGLSRSTRFWPDQTMIDELDNALGADTESMKAEVLSDSASWVKMETAAGEAYQVSFINNPEETWSLNRDSISGIMIGSKMTRMSLAEFKAELDVQNLLTDADLAADFELDLTQPYLAINKVTSINGSSYQISRADDSAYNWQISMDPVNSVPMLTKSERISSSVLKDLLLSDVGNADSNVLLPENFNLPQLLNQKFLTANKVTSVGGIISYQMSLPDNSLQ
ncbi:MAG TPA: hypothetical protein PLY88_03075, partial [Candidatus Omnitrophota bacterium]|nr:hypothetical protein [Candidatus Omnitrophota bacterium]